MPQQAPSRGNPIQDYITVAERIEKFYERFPEGRIITHIIEHDAERGFILIRAEVYRNAEDALPAATGHAYELKSEGYVQRTSYIEVGETSAVGRALAMAGFEVRRGIASREEMEKSGRHEKEDGKHKSADPNGPATDEQKQAILGLLEAAKPGDRRAQRNLLKESTGKESRDDLTQAEAGDLIKKLQQQTASAK